MKLNIQDLKCDCCGHYELMDYQDYKYNINKPCPECGSNLLTVEQYLKCEKWMSMVEKVNRINNILKWINPFFYIKLLILGNEDKEHKIKIK